MLGTVPSSVSGLMAFRPAAARRTAPASMSRYSSTDRQFLAQRHEGLIVPQPPAQHAESLRISVRAASGAWCGQRRDRRQLLNRKWG